MGLAGVPAVVKAAAAAMTPVVTFFGVPLLWVLLGFLTLDWLTGLRKAAIQNKIASYRLGAAVDRAVYYLVIYGVVHAITVFVPLGIYAGMPEGLILAIYSMKEAVSVLENLRAIQALNGQETEILDRIIKRMGLDLDRMQGEVEESLNKKNKDNAES